jgi:alpha-1,3-mannosyl-glycoprotein beta-1,2-N-acetylglucosaminyltransferase
VCSFKFNLYRYNKRLWSELQPKWPDSFWDDWMRLGSTRKGRESIHPEVCRTFNFGEIGSSKGQFFKMYLANIRLAQSDIDWSVEDLSYLAAGEYEAATMAAVDTATPALGPKDVKLRNFVGSAGVGGGGEEEAEEGQHQQSENVYKVVYYSFDDFKNKAKRFGIFAEWKDGVPRGGYRGVVTFKMYGGRATVLMVPGYGMEVAKTYQFYRAAEERGARHEGAADGGGEGAGVGVDVAFR